VKEAGREGGEATAENHDKEFFQEIGQKVGKHEPTNEMAAATPTITVTGKRAVVKDLI
jgi:general stress protein YciG